jgi:hypothetical protein
MRFLERCQVVTLHVLDERCCQLIRFGLGQIGSHPTGHDVELGHHGCGCSAMSCQDAVAILQGHDHERLDDA